MNIVNKLTLRQMRKNKRQTLVTIIGVIISVAMVSAVAILATSFLNLMQREIIVEEGDWHVEFQNLNEEQVQAIQTDKNTDKSYLSRDVGFAYLEGSENEEKPYVFLKQFDQRGLEEYPMQLTEGRMPEHEGEVVLSEHIDTNAGVTYDIGDEITLEVGSRVIDQATAEDRGMPETATIDETYSLIRDDDDENVNETIDVESTKSLKVVGFIERPDWEPYWSPGYTIVSYLDPIKVSSKDKVNLLVTNKKVGRNFYKDTQSYAKEHNIDSYEMHDSLLQTYGVFSNLGMAQALFIFVGIIMVIIMIGSVSLIYNAFAISVSERSRQLGMLSSVGATKKQKRNSVLFEGAVIGAISIPLGFLSGILGLAVTFYFINDKLTNAFGFTETLRVAVTPFTVVFALIVSVLTIFISVYIPARRASKISAIDAIRQSEDIKLTHKKIKTSKLVRKLFGFEAEIGLKNLKRNKKRYVATVFSLFISIVLFLSVAFFTDTLKRTLELTQDGQNYDIEVAFDKNDQLTKEDQDTIEEIKQFSDVTDSNLVLSGWLNTLIDEKYIPEESKDQIEEESSEAEVPFGVYLHVLEDDALEQFADEAGVSEQQLYDTESVQGIIINWTSIIDVDDNAYKEQRAIDVKKGENIDLNVENYEGDGVHIGQLTVAGISNSFPMGVEPIRYQLGVNVVISETGYEQLKIEEYDFIFPPYYTLYLTSSDAIITGDEIAALDYPGLSMFNFAKMNQDDQQFSFVISVFVYGFITLITLISVANIFNTITTSIALRKREFGMLKSVGMTPKGFNKMIRYESIFYGLKALLYGLPISIGLMYLMHIALSDGFELTFKIPWIPVGIVIVAVFVIVSISMLYASAKLKKQNIIDALKQENM